jgi:hypothetical protein
MKGILVLFLNLFVCASAGTLWLIILISYLEMRRVKKAGKGQCWFCGSMGKAG